MRRAALILLALLPVVLITLLFAAPNFLGTTYSLSLNSLLSASAPAAAGSSLGQTQQISLLESEVLRLKEQLLQVQADTAKAGSQGTAAAPAVIAPPAVITPPQSNTSVVIDLFKFLGLQSAYAGVSWDPYACFPPPKTVWPKMSDDSLKKLEERIVQALVLMVAKLKKVDPKDIDPKEPYHRLLGRDDEGVYVSDQDFTAWRAAIMPTLAPFIANAYQNMFIVCNKTREKKVWPEDMGTPAVDCSDELNQSSIIQSMGYYAMPYESIDAIAHGLATVGICTSQVRGHAASYAHWMRQDRIYNPDWHTFSVATREQDAVVLLLDLLYEKLAIFTRQYWLGVINMQNPFDMYSIQDIIFTTRPTLMVETGTANGGSALLWASIMHLAEMNASRIMTIDMNAPKWEAGSASWGGVAREDPTKHRLWKEHVKFLQGSTTDSAIYNQVRDAAAGQQVMVLLDSHHTEEHVSGEMALYCPLVSVGCFCIVEDTKMSRWSSTGPLESVKKFMKGEWGKHFELVRDRELLYTHHAMGYLKRIS